MMETGQLMSAEVMPKLTKRMSEFVRENGALGKSMQTVNAEQGRFQTALTGGKEALFKGGMGEGMAYFFKTSATFLGEMQPLLKWLGGFIKGVIASVTGLAQILAVPLNILSDMAKMFGGTGDFAAAVGATGVLTLIAARFGLIGKFVLGINMSLIMMMGNLVKILTPLLLIEDIYTSMSGGKSVTGMNFQSTETSPWYSRYGIYHAGYKIDNGEIGVKFFFDSEEMKKFIRVEQVSGNKAIYAGLAAELN